jgi:hypothetical protein
MKSWLALALLAAGGWLFFRWFKTQGGATSAAADTPAAGALDSTGLPPISVVGPTIVEANPLGDIASSLFNSNGMQAFSAKTADGTVNAGWVDGILRGLTVKTADGVISSTWPYANPKEADNRGGSYIFKQDP